MTKRQSVYAFGAILLAVMALAITGLTSTVRAYSANETVPMPVSTGLIDCVTIGDSNEQFIDSTLRWSRLHLTLRA